MPPPVSSALSFHGEGEGFAEAGDLVVGGGGLGIEEGEGEDQEDTRTI